jgi:hypothetical protein
MKTEAMLSKLQSKSPILNGLTGLAGFAAGALLVGVIALDQAPASQAAESHSLAMPSAAARQAPRIEVASPQIPAQAAAPWPFESTASAPARDPGKNRPDRLSAPEGWTYTAE